MRKYVISLACLFLLCFGTLSLLYRQESIRRERLAEPVPAESLPQKQEGGLRQADNVSRLVVNTGMRYLLETCDIADGTRTTQVLEVPKELLGMTREEVVGYLSGRTENPSEEDLREGLVNYELSSFSAQSMTVVKTVGAQPEYEYYLVAENGYLLVYLGDRTTSYLFTHISLTEFPEKERSQLMEGKGFHSMLELFNYLESYTS